VLEGDVGGGDRRVVLSEVTIGTEFGGSGDADEGDLDGLASAGLSGGEDAGEGTEGGELALEGSDDGLGQDGRGVCDGVSQGVLG
jgi:hypothetical protein